MAGHLKLICIIRKPFNHKQKKKKKTALLKTYPGLQKVDPSIPLHSKDNT